MALSGAFLLTTTSQVNAADEAKSQARAREKIPVSL